MANNLTAALHTSVAGLLLLASCADGPSGSVPIEVRVEGASDLILEPCATRQLVAVVEGSGDRGVRWKSSDTTTASVSAAGEVTARNPGQAVLTASAAADTTRRATISLTVVPTPVRLLVSGGTVDTIQTRVAEPVVAQARWSGGCPAGGIRVAFTSPTVSTGVPSPSPSPAILLASTLDGAGTGGTRVEGVSDRDGKVSVYAALGSKAGSYAVVASASGPAASPDSALFTVRPGRPVLVVAAPADTAAYAGAGYTLRVRVEDRAGNPPEQPPLLSSTRPDVAQVATDGSVRAVGTGRVRLRIRAGDLADSVALSVVPRGTLVAYNRRYSSGELAEMYVLNLDGSGYRTILSGASGFNTRDPRWLPSGDRIIYSEILPNNPDRPLRLFTIDLQGNVQQFAPGISVPAERFNPQPSRDGQWVYFTGRPGYNLLDVWRVRSDGTRAERVSADTAFAQHEYVPTPSPEGGRVAYITNAAGSARIRVLDLRTRGESRIDVPGTRPVWAPAGEEIAYLANGQLRVVRADGSGALTLDDAGRYDASEGSITWSPDGLWLVGCVTGAFSGDRSLVLVNRQTREVLPLAHTASRRLCQADWQP